MKYVIKKNWRELRRELIKNQRHDSSLKKYIQNHPESIITESDGLIRMQDENGCRVIVPTTLGEKLAVGTHKL